MRHHLGRVSQLRVEEWEFSDALMEWFALYNGRPALFTGDQYAIVPRIAVRWADCHGLLLGELIESAERYSPPFSNADLSSGTMGQRIRKAITSAGLDVYEMRRVPGRKRGWVYVKVAAAASCGARGYVIDELLARGAVVPQLVGPSQSVEFSASFLGRVEVIHS